MSRYKVKPYVNPAEAKKELAKEMQALKDAVGVAESKAKALEAALEKAKADNALLVKEVKKLKAAAKASSEE